MVKLILVKKEEEKGKKKSEVAIDYMLTPRLLSKFIVYQATCISLTLALPSVSKIQSHLFNSFSLLYSARCCSFYYPHTYLLAYLKISWERKSVHEDGGELWCMCLLRPKNLLIQQGKWFISFDAIIICQIMFTCTENSFLVGSGFHLFRLSQYRFRKRASR